MEYYLPVYTTANPVAKKQCDVALGAFQRAFYDARQLGVPLAFKKVVQNYDEHEDDVWENALKLAKRVADILNVDDFVEPEMNTVIETWFGKSVYFDKKEYALVEGVWYERKWKKHKLTKPKLDRSVVYWRNEIGKMKMVESLPTAKQIVGLAMVHPGKKGEEVRSLANGQKFEKKSKQIAADRFRHMKRRETLKTFDEHVDHLQNVKKIVDQKVRDRGIYINDTVAEILNLSRLVTVMGPINYSEKFYFAQHGITELKNRLKLVECQTRNQAQNVHIIDYDASLLYPLYADIEINKHSTLASLLLGPMRQCAVDRKAAAKTVKAK